MAYLHGCRYHQVDDKTVEGDDRVPSVEASARVFREGGRGAGMKLGTEWLGQP